MLIVSNFRDYYDSIQGVGVDKTCVYNRKTQPTGVEFGGFYKGSYLYVRESVVIGFCGTFYPMKLIYSNKDSEKPEEIITTLKGWLSFKRSKGIKVYRKKPDWNFSRKDYFEPKSWEKDFGSFFQKYKVPIFLIDSRGLVLNPKLEDYEFYKVKDPYTAYQDIYMYLSGVLGINERPMINISDQDMAAKKGFDKWSFKKPPGQKKRRKKNHE